MALEASETLRSSSRWESRRLAISARLAVMNCHRDAKHSAGALLQQEGYHARFLADTPRE